MHVPSSLESKLIRTLTLIGAIAVTGILTIVPYRLYTRDIRHAKVEAHRLSSLIHIALSDALRREEDVTDLVNRLHAITDFDLALRKLAPDEETNARIARRAQSSPPFGTDLYYTTPPILDGKGSMWLAEMHFDLSSMKRESIRLIIDLVLAVVLGSLAFSVGIFFLVRNTLLVPLRRLTGYVESLRPEDEIREIPEFSSREMHDLAHALHQAFQIRRPPHS